MTLSTVGHCKNKKLQLATNLQQNKFSDIFKSELSRNAEAIPVVHSGKTMRHIEIGHTFSNS